MYRSGWGGGGGERGAEKKTFQLGSQMKKKQDHEAAPFLGSQTQVYSCLPHVWTTGMQTFINIYMTALLTIVRLVANYVRELKLSYLMLRGG
jgi:hypothetical protein